MASRLPVRKTYKLFIGGSFPRSESGRTYEAEGQNVSRASRKDVRDAVRAARDGHLEEIERLAADNVKRVVRGHADAESPWEIAAFLELKTVWHPVGV